ncbi:hypothetical protein Pla52n_23690 [Stieleria varia]|uniref:Uncharacterized protein n=1 Tax=Stieleria varia TaxID=2528005 RepID=A0A5C6AYU9_9BACT|nr:hypothetical protein Pla52n_23690 [Stieleria varia]
MVVSRVLDQPECAGLFKIWGCGILGLRKFMSLLPAKLVDSSEPQALAVGLRRIVVPAHG